MLMIKDVYFNVIIKLWHFIFSQTYFSSIGQSTLKAEYRALAPTRKTELLVGRRAPEEVNLFVGSLNENINFLQ